MKTTAKLMPCPVCKERPEEHPVRDLIMGGKASILCRQETHFVLVYGRTLVEARRLWNASMDKETR